ncbi:MAG: hypothetical protein PHN89_05370 [Candidatus Pacebacteria bacterium]|nr:hypothetical protein [Candidatus Paceibacterota bacterium]
MKEIAEIEQIISDGIQSPQLAAELRIELSAKYSRECGRLEEILKVKPKIWLEMRKNTKSDTSATRNWEGSELGTEEMIIRLRLKRLEKLISCLTSFLKVKENEAKNIY